MHWDISVIEFDKNNLSCETVVDCVEVAAGSDDFLHPL
jgi:hypothetical protein